MSNETPVLHGPTTHDTLLWLGLLELLGGTWRGRLGKLGGVCRSSPLTVCSADRTAIAIPSL